MLETGHLLRCNSWSFWWILLSQDSSYLRVFFLSFCLFRSPLFLIGLFASPCVYIPSNISSSFKPQFTSHHRPESTSRDHLKTAIGLMEKS
ncbi:hypothetical protein CDAR_480071 [Caerostris darwini]|uniref:Uncharacterized protein n=1 Tax=Caerostris darwini TaxID=1538125 RepID=A0AAV4T2J5_9ARAC|nr:hypothetical protein CDAR_480071 [Caerostris darwini]